jgi:hypothetical protein
MKNFLNLQVVGGIVIPLVFAASAQAATTTYTCGNQTTKVVFNTKTPNEVTIKVLEQEGGTEVQASYTLERVTQQVSDVEEFSDGVISVRKVGTLVTVNLGFGPVSCQ